MTTEELAALKVRIAEAEAAYHGLMIGNAIRSVTDQNGEKVEFAFANRANLYAYLQDLKSQLPEAGQRYAAPVRFYF